MTNHGMADCICVEDAFCKADCPAMDCNQEGRKPEGKPLTDAELEMYQNYADRAAIGPIHTLRNEALSWRGSIAMRDVENALLEARVRGYQVAVKVAGAQIGELSEKNAALVTEIEELKERLEHAHDYPNHNALARVRGAE